LGRPIILSGGITLLNVELALNTVRPYAIDVNSGVEERPGKKSRILMTKLMETVRKITIGGMLNEGNGLLR
jgi:phosphoribosylanthranilate isomerase